MHHHGLAGLSRGLQDLDAGGHARVVHGAIDDVHGVAFEKLPEIFVDVRDAIQLGHFPPVLANVGDGHDTVPSQAVSGQMLRAYDAGIADNADTIVKLVGLDRRTVRGPFEFAKRVMGHGTFSPIGL